MKYETTYPRYVCALIFLLMSAWCIASQRHIQENQKNYSLLASDGVGSGINTIEKSVYFISPQDGSQVTNPITFRFGLTNLGLAPAELAAPNTGHHHLLINVEELPPLHLPIPKNENHLHFGGGESEATLELPPGKHTLQLLFSDHNHIPGDPPVISEKITISVIDPPYQRREGVYFITPRDKQIVSSPLRVRFGLNKKWVAIAPTSIRVPNSGHHHLLINVDVLPPMNLPIPSDENHLHFSGGETETLIDLSPGKHTLQLLFSDYNHIPHNPPIISQKITVFVE